MPPLRRESRIQHLIVHTLETRHLIGQGGFVQFVRIEEMRHHSFEHDIRMALQFFDDAWQFIFLDAFAIHPRIEEQMDLRRFA